MNTKVIMIASAVFMGLLGITFTFLSQEILGFFDQAATELVQLCLQILGALFLSFAIVNWMSKAVLIGGIYNRPLALANALHFSVGAITLIKALSTLEQSNPILMVITLCYGLFALLFIKIIFTTPKKVSKQT